MSSSSTRSNGELTAMIERLRASATDNGSAFDEISAAIKLMIHDQQFDQAAEAIRQLASPLRDYTSIQSLVRFFHGCQGQRKPCSQKVRLAVLSSFTSHQLVDMIRLFLFSGDVDTEIYEADYGVFRQEILDPTSKLYSFQPTTIIIATSWRDLTYQPRIGEEPQRVSELVVAEQAEWSRLWQTTHERLGCQIIQNNFDHPSWRQLGNHELRQPGTLGNFISQVNQSLFVNSPPWVTIHDLDGLSSWVGRRSWSDERFFHHAKLPCAPEHLVDYAHNLASILLAQMGMSKKCLVLDLDNTLWGGVIGDDGLGGIRLGQGDVEGEGFLAFQRYALKLRQRGVILAVCSKNTDANAREPFDKHPEMQLKLDDISCFIANWDDKAANIRAIARQLNIGLNSLVFVDDNPAERAIVRQLLPEVAVPEVSGDPTDFIAALERHRYFQSVYLGKEDLRRTELYRDNAQRQAIASSAQSIEEFLISLQMTATVEPINDVSLERSTQLINKSNQFNLTTIRRSTAEVTAIMRDSTNWITRTASLKDRFGDNGLISVVLARIEGDTLDLDTWLMSCRVLKRNVEQLLLNNLCRAAKSRGLRKLIGHYIPTAKNDLVKNHYDGLGFARIGSEPNGTCHYSLDVDGYRRFTTFIEESGKE